MTMAEPVIDQEIAKLDLSQVAALQQKRTLAFVNHFVTTTVQFLNNFTKKCEHRLMHYERKLEKIDAAMVLLEAKLSSIPEVNTPSESVLLDTQTKTTEGPAEAKSTENSEDNTNKEESSKELENANKDSEVNKDNEKIQISPEYERFVKMVQVGVPLEAVKLKATLEGLDPNILQKILSK